MVDSKLPISMNFKGSQHQIQRIKKQDDEEHWISEEELYTEGSSDEEKLPNSSRKVNKKGRKMNFNEKSHQLTSNVKSFSNDKLKNNYISEANDMNTVHRSDISWRPKRGSMKLPGIDLSENYQTSNTS